jgi:hypothetical protein
LHDLGDRADHDFSGNCDQRAELGDGQRSLTAGFSVEMNPSPAANIQ